MTSAFFGPFASGFFLPLLIASAGHSQGGSECVSEKVDLIELNHHYDDLGRHNYDQVIFYEWCPEYKRFHVIAWCLVDEEETRRPRRSARLGKWTVHWQDRNPGIVRVVESRLFRETWSQVDPERANKELLQEKHRLSFAQIPKRNF
ncbi:MAG: hypothetical protein Aurels2KO_33880 [Aureliella sp.]